MKKQKYMLLVIVFMSLVPSYSQNVVNLSLSTQELKNGIILFNEKKYNAAIQAFEAALAYEPRNYAARYRLGAAFLHAGYIQNAIKSWESLVNDGVADHQVKENLNILYFQISKDQKYEYDEPYIFRNYYDGFTQGNHLIQRSSFVVYDPSSDTKLISSSGSKLVVEMNNANNIIQTYGNRFFQKKIFEMPTGIGIFDNNIYVADYKKNTINIFEKGLQAKHIKEFGADNLLGPMGLVFDNNYLYVVDNGNHEIKKFSPDGTFIAKFGKDNLYRPTDIVLTETWILVSDISSKNQGRVARFDHYGNFVDYIGENFLQQPRGLYLDGQDLYISDGTGNLYIYNFLNETSRTLNNSDDKLSYPFDLIKDKDKILWRTDFNSQKIAIYTPLQGVYGNIDISIPQIFTDHYPYVYALVRARNRDGSPLSGLSSSEIKLSEFDIPINSVLVNTESYRSKMLTHLIIDRSLDSERHLDQMELYLKTFLSNNTSQDEIIISLIDDKVIKTDRMPVDILKIWNFITNYQPQSSHAAEWDRHIYYSIPSLFNNLRNRSVVIFTSGGEENVQFSTYGPNIIKTFADQNNIPIYVVNFSDKNHGFWSTISQPHGKYYHHISDAKNIMELHSTIQKSPPLEYLIEYQALNYSDTPGLWIDLHLQLNRFGVNGTTLGGYYVPTPSQKNINLIQEFTP